MQRPALLGFEALDVFEGAGDDDVVFGGEDVAGDGEDGFRPALLDGEDVEVIFFADIGGYDVLAHPFFRDGELEDAVIVIQLDEVEYIFRVIAHGGFERHILLRIDDLVGAVTEQELALDFAAGHGNDVFCAQIFGERAHFKGRLEAGAHGYEHDVEVIHADFLQHFFLRAVAGECVGEAGREALDDVLVLIHDHDLIAHIREVLREICAESSHSYYEYGFHFFLLLAYQYFFVRARSQRRLRLCHHGARQGEHAHPAGIHEQDEYHLRPRRKRGGNSRSKPHRADGGAAFKQHLRKSVRLYRADDHHREHGEDEVDGKERHCLLHQRKIHAALADDYLLLSANGRVKPEEDDHDGGDLNAAGGGTGVAADEHEDIH